MNWQDKFEQEINDAMDNIKSTAEFKFHARKLPENMSSFEFGKVFKGPDGEIKEMKIKAGGCFDNGEPYDKEKDGGYCSNNHHIPVGIRHVCPLSGIKICELPGCGVRVGGKYYARPYCYLALVMLILKFIFRPVFWLFGFPPNSMLRPNQDRQELIKQQQAGGKEQIDYGKNPEDLLKNPLNWEKLNNARKKWDE